MIGFSAFLQTLSARLSPILRPPIYDMPRNSHMQTFLKIVSPYAPVNSLSPASSPLFRATGTIRNRRKTRRNTVGKDRPVTFNRYILFRMVVEFVGAIACAIQMFQHHTWPGIITMSGRSSESSLRTNAVFNPATARYTGTTALPSLGSSADFSALGLVSW